MKTGDLRYYHEPTPDWAIEWDVFLIKLTPRLYLSFCITNKIECFSEAGADYPNNFTRSTPW